MDLIVDIASKAQTYYLFLLTGLDSRNCNLGKKVCGELIALWNDGSEEDRDFVYDFLVVKNAVVRRKKKIPKNTKKEKVIMNTNKFSRKETYDKIDGFINSNKSWGEIVQFLNKEGHSTPRIKVGGWKTKNSYDFYRKIRDGHRSYRPERPTGVRKVHQERRIEMCKLLNSGKTIKEISAKFNICEVAVRSAIKTALRKNEAVVNVDHGFRAKSTKRTKNKNKNKVLVAAPVAASVPKPNFPSFAISEMKSVLDSILDSNMDNNSKVAIIKTVLGHKA